LDLEYWFKPLPEGTLTSEWTKTTALFHSIYFISIILPIMWVAINLEELRTVAIIYLIIGLWINLISITERLSPPKVPWSFMPVRFENFIQQTLAALIILAITVMSGIQISSFVPFTIMAPPSQIVSIIKIYLWQFGFLSLEESFFGQYLGATLCEKIGIIPGALINAVIFVGFHYSMYGWAANILISLFIFRFLGSIANAIYRSMVPSAETHFLINLIALKSIGAY